MTAEPRNWCPGSGSHDEYYWQIASDHVRCVHCLRPLMLTRKLTLPKHVWQQTTPAHPAADPQVTESARTTSSDGGPTDA